MPKSSGHIGLDPSKNSAWHHRWMCEMHAGGYDIDKRPPEPMTLPEVCAFNDDGLLHKGKFYTPCQGELYVQVDIRFGIIPVCQNHIKFVKKETHAAKKRIRVNPRSHTEQDFGESYSGA